MKHRVWILLSLLLVGWTETSFASITNEFATPSPALLEEIHQAFPESQEVSPSLLNYQVDPNLHLFQEAQIKVSFLDEGAEMKNSFGYFLYQDLDGDGKISDSEILIRQILWENASKIDSGGSLVSGDALNLGKFPAGTRVGFFLVANGFQGGTETYYTLDAKNSDGHRHLAMLATANRDAIILGIEDLPWEGSDRDFNDLLFTVSVDPKSALLEAIDAGHIPVNPGSNFQASAGTPAAPEIPAVALAPATTPPAYLEGSGRGCELSRNAGATNDRLIWKSCFHCLAVVFALARWRSKAVSGTAKNRWRS